jgi:hypothetical protein
MARPRVACWVLLGVVFGLALALRVWYVLVLPGQGRDEIFSDMWTYDYTAWQLVRGQPVRGAPGLNSYHPLSASTYYYAGYTYFIAAVYAAFGHSPAAVRVTQAVVGALTVGVVYRLGTLVFGRRPALLGAALTAVYLPLVYYAGLLLTETWYTFAQAVALALLAGIMAGLTCLTRPLFVLSAALLAAGGWAVPPVAARGATGRPWSPRSCSGPPRRSPRSRSATTRSTAASS